jgi:7-carboxy-7-deazaguanine synthase
MESVRVTEIFRSIQGESTWAGLPCAFVRLTGCNLRCAYCDTRYAYEGGEEMTVDTVVDACAKLGAPLVEVTGGEPLNQPGCVPLVKAMLERGWTVLVETNGSVWAGGLPADAVKVLDFKCPGSGMADRNDWRNVDALTPRDEVKFAIGDRADYEWSRDVVAKYALPARCRQVLFSPVFGRIEPRRIVEWILDDGLNVRFQLQLHKYIWPPDQRGV